MTNASILLLYWILLRNHRSAMGNRLGSTMILNFTERILEFFLNIVFYDFSEIRKQKVKQIITH